LGAETTAQLRFFDTTGRQVLTSRMQGPLKVLDVSVLNGLYSVVVVTPAASFVERVVIQ